jgi:IS5 family transposase
MNKSNPFEPVPQLFLFRPDTEFGEYCKLMDDVVRANPSILTLIEKDLELHGKLKKQSRLRDKQWKENKKARLPGTNAINTPIKVSTLSLKEGRPRMTSYTAYIFLIGRGYYGGIKSSDGAVFTRESKTLHIFLANQGIHMPSANCVYDNINAISNKTRDYILDAQVNYIMEKQWDDFKTLTADSTAISGNVSWPKDSTIIWQLSVRIFKSGKTLYLYGIRNMGNRYFKRLLKELKSLSNKINMESGKTHSIKKRRKYYRKLLSTSKEINQLFEKELTVINQSVERVILKPTKKDTLDRLVLMIETDIATLKRVEQYCRNRIFNEETLPAKDKIMSISGKDAAYIQKGNREAYIGYKPQLVRSKNGFISSIIIPNGNQSDSSQLLPLINQTMSRTSVIPDEVSVDDGYTSKYNRNTLLRNNIKVVSFSGAKGKKITPEDQWESLEYQAARNNRSAVESMIYLIKHKFDFGRVLRRGINNVTAELLEKVLAYNLCRIIQVSTKQKVPLQLVA